MIIKETEQLIKQYGYEVSQCYKISSSDETEFCVFDLVCQNENFFLATNHEKSFEKIGRAKVIKTVSFLDNIEKILYLWFFKSREESEKFYDIHWGRYKQDKIQSLLDKQDIQKSLKIQID